MKRISLALLLGLLVISSLYAQQTVVIERPGVLTDLANAAGTIVALPLAVVEGIVVGTTEAAGSLLHGSTQVIVTVPAKPVPTPTVIVTVPAKPVPTPTVIVPAPPIVTSPPVMVAPSSAVIPTTTIVTTHSDGTVTTVTRQASAYEHGPVILTPVNPTHLVGSSPHVNPYVFRPQ